MDIQTSLIPMEKYLCSYIKILRLSSSILQVSHAWRLVMCKIRLSPKVVPKIHTNEARMWIDIPCKWPSLEAVIKLKGFPLPQIWKGNTWHGGHPQPVISLSWGTTLHTNHKILPPSQAWQITSIAVTSHGRHKDVLRSEAYFLPTKYRVISKIVA